MAACFNEPNYSDVPAIQLLGPPVKQYKPAGEKVGQSPRDSIITTIRYQDGTGDIGEDPRDTARIRKVFGKETWGNYEITTFQFVDGKFTALPASDNGKVYFPGPPRLQKGAVEGTIDFSQVFPYQRPYKLVPVKFQIRIRDRALNVSNVLETDTITVPLNGR
jgi:hypothetical protein